VLLLPRPRIAAITDDRFALVKTSISSGASRLVGSPRRP
jgi:hypothetical protein